MTNPNPTYITDAMWTLWLTVEGIIPGVRLGGIYANKSGYHNTVNSNKKSWPGNYSIQLYLDLTEPDNKARAIDLTMDNEQMVQRTGYLQKSALDPQDTRLACVREFYGTLNTTSVYGLIKDNEGGPWRFASSDSSHLWHIHISTFTTFVALWSQLSAIASVLSGQSYADWINGGSGPIEEEEYDMLMVAAVNEPDGTQTFWAGDGFYHRQIDNAGQANDLVSAIALFYGSPRAVLLTYGSTPRAAVLGMIGPNKLPTSTGGGSVTGPVDLTTNAVNQVASATATATVTKLHTDPEGDGPGT